MKGVDLMAWTARAFFVCFIVLSAPSASWGGTVFAPPSKEAPLGAGESYPESRFGRPPMRVDMGVSSGYASRAVTEMEQGDDPEAHGGNRYPAGTEWGVAPSRKERAIASAEAGASAQAPREPDAGNTASVVARKGVQEVAVIANDLGYYPKTLFVTRDVPVRLYVTGASKNTLCLMMDSFQIRKQIRSQKVEEITFTPANPGKYRFYCPVNGMEGTMIVKELGQASEP